MKKTTRKHRITKKGYEKLKQEHSVLKDKKRPITLKSLSKARDMGDLAENSAYHAAREELQFLDKRIQEIEDILREIEIVEESIREAVVGLGKRVTVKKDNMEHTYHIVGELEADITVGKMSETSPIGQALLGKKKGDCIKIMIPAGEVTYTIKDIH